MTSQTDQELSSLRQQIHLLSLGLDTAWLSLTAFGIVLTQIGFASLEASSSKDVRSVLFKNLLDHSVSSLAWYAVGYSLFEGRDSEDYPRVLQQFGFEITVASVVSACVLGRLRMATYLGFTGVLAACAYPVLAFSCWTEGGYLREKGFRDFGGSGVVHLFGAVCGMVGSKLCGPRMNVLTLQEKQVLQQQAAPFLALGGLVLYVAFFFVNAGSSASLTSLEAIRAAGRAGWNTALSSGAASLCGYFLCRTSKSHKYDLAFLVNCLVSGIVANTGPSGFVSPTSAACIGFGAPFVYVASVRFVRDTLQIDDPLDAISVHGASGCYGIICLGLFHIENGMLISFQWWFLMTQIWGCVLITCWGLTVSLVYFGLCKRFKVLAYTREEQMIGLDASFMGDYFIQWGDSVKTSAAPSSPLANFSIVDDNGRAQGSEDGTIDVMGGGSNVGSGGGGLGGRSYQDGQGNA